MMSSENDFQHLVAIIDRLLGPDGCPWDQEQTVHSLSHMVLEEICELIDALDETDSEKQADELGDVMIVALFLAKVAEKEHRFSWTLPLQKAALKMIRRHPHIFNEEQKLTSAKAVEQRWDDIKATEVEHSGRTTRLDGIPKSLPALAMMQKLLSKVKKAPSLHPASEDLLQSPRDSEEEELGRRIAQLIVEGDRRGIQAEHALRLFFTSCYKALIEHERQAVAGSAFQT